MRNQSFLEKGKKAKIKSGKIRKQSELTSKRKPIKKDKSKSVVLEC